MPVVVRRPRSGLIAMLVVVAGLVLAACGGSSGSSTPTTAAAPDTSAGGSTAATGEKVDLTMWFWGEADAPGANDWLAATVKSYEAANQHSRFPFLIRRDSRQGLRARRSCRRGRSSGRGRSYCHFCHRCSLKRFYRNLVL